MIFNETEIRDKWLHDEKLYHSIAKQIVSEVCSLFTTITIHAETSYRVKDIDSLLKKMLRKGYTYDKIQDKAGVRVIVQFKDDLIKLDKAIKDTFGERIVNRDDKTESLDEYKFGYQSIHYDILNSDNMYCELQIRTICQHNWSMMSHYLSYKKDNIPIEIRRQINALSALFEVADTQFQNIHNMISALPNTSEISIYNNILMLYRRLTSKDYSVDMTNYFFDNITNFYIENENIVELLEEFLNLNYKQLSNLVNSFTGNLFYSQPEILIILERLTNRKIFFKTKWTEIYPIELLDSIAIVWGVSID